VYGSTVSSSSLTCTVPRCLAHIINLVTQALISTHSKSKHYDPAEPDADLTVGVMGSLVGTYNKYWACQFYDGERAHDGGLCDCLTSPSGNVLMD